MKKESITELTESQITTILAISNPRERAFFSILAETGLRPGTLAKLRRKHIEPEFTQGIIPCPIHIPKELFRGKSQFISIPEKSIEYLKAYFITRQSVNLEDYLFTCEGTNRRVNSKSMSGIFSRTLEKLKAKGLIEFQQKANGKPRTVRLFSLCKFSENKT